MIYTLESRYELLGAKREDLKKLEPVTKAFAGSFAERPRGVLDARWGISELGIAGPTGSSDGHAPGTSAVAVAGPESRVVRVETGDSDRELNMWSFTEAALRLRAEAPDEAASR